MGGNKTHHRKEKSTSKVLELMHTDLCGKIEPMGLRGESCKQLITDDYTGAMWVSSMPFKSGVAEGTRAMMLHAQNLSGKKLATLRPDSELEFKGDCFHVGPWSIQHCQETEWRKNRIMQMGVRSQERR